MLQIDNRTPFSAQLCVFADPAGVETVYAVVKAAFDITAKGLMPTVKPLPLLAGDVYWGDPAKTGIYAAGELSLTKPATDILLLGSAYAATHATRGMDMSFRVGPVAQTLRIFGPRLWERGRISPPEPFEKVPLRWELAFGGFEVPEAGKPAMEYEPRNPVGRGFIGSRERSFDGRPLPQIEDPRQPIQKPGDRPAPACCAPVAPSWSPRREYAGTYDEAWTRQRAPYLPCDFDPRFFNVAPPGLVAPGFLKGGEAVEVTGCLPGGARMAFQLPVCSIATRYHFRGKEIERPTALDTVILEPDKYRVQLVYRSALAVDKHTLKLSKVRVDCREYGRFAPHEAVVA